MSSQTNSKFRAYGTNNLSIFNDNLLYKQHIKKCLYIAYSLQNHTSDHWITRLPPFLLKNILFEYIVDPFTVGRYYSIIDNFNSNFKFDSIKCKS